MNNTAAIFYKRDGYDTSGVRLLGRQAAGEGFLKAFVQHGTADSLYCYTSSQREFAEFCDRIQPWMKRPRQVKWLSTSNHQVLAQAGTIYQPDPVLSKHAWTRRFYDQRGYSICGVTHTIASMDSMASIGDLLIAPLQPWDALICTSVAVKNAIERLLNTWAEYLAQRTGGKPNIHIQLPIIPLGIDCDAFNQGDNATNTRNGRQHAKKTYDWKVVIAAYENFWQELAEIRAAAPMSVPLQPGNPPVPLCDDPFRLFAHYTSTTPNQDLVLELGAMSTPEGLQQIRQNWMTNFGADTRNTNSIIDAVLVAMAIAQNNPVSIETILNSHADVSPTQLLRTLVYLVKFDVLRVKDSH